MKTFAISGDDYSIYSIFQYKAELVAAFSERAMPHFANGTYRPIIYKIFDSLQQLPDAHRMMEANENTGKIVLKVAAGNTKTEL
jgi:NADPH:quinone reductase-like Zn-dependent oxidoreductase